MQKGQATRDAILDRAIELARAVGLEGLTIGRLADDLKLSKSGLFAHARSKEALQVQVLERAAEHFIDQVLRPTLAVRRGEKRVRALFDHWLEWQRRSNGCIFVQAAVDLDDRPGAARERLIALQKDWLDSIASTARGAIAEGEFKSDLDPVQFAHDVNAIYLGYHHAARLLKDPDAERRARAAFDALLQAAHPTSVR